MATQTQVVPAKPPTIQQAAQTTGLARKVFTQGNSGVSGGQLVMEFQQVLKLAGINLTVPETVTLGTVQIALAGGAIANDFETGVATLQCVGDIGIGVAGVSEILSALGIIDTTVADFIGLATDLALVFASGGANVLADIGAVFQTIKCAIDVGPALFGSSAQAKADATRQLQAIVTSETAPQIQNTALLLKEYALGSVNLFDMIGEIALNDPTQFATAFPGLAIVFPSWFAENYSQTVTSSGWFSSKTDTETETIYKLITTRTQVQDVLVETYLTKPMQDFESFETIAPIISLQAASVLSLILSSGSGGDVTMGFNFNVVGTMIALGVTPSILGDDWLFKGLQRNEKDLANWQDFLPYPPLTLPYVQKVNAGVQVNGVDSFTADEAAQNASAQSLINLQLLMQKLDDNGDIESLMKIPEAVTMLSRYGNFAISPTFYTADQLYQDMQTYQTELNTLTQEYNGTLGNSNDAQTASQLKNEIAALVKPNVPVGEILNMKLTGTSITTQSWYYLGISTDPKTADGAAFWNYVYLNYAIDLSDYWRVLQTLQKMQASELMQGDTQVAEFQGSIDTLTETYNSAYGFTIAKNLNIRARASIAQTLGIPVDKLTARYDSAGNLVFYQKGSS